MSTGGKGKKKSTLKKLRKIHLLKIYKNLDKQEQNAETLVDKQRKFPLKIYLKN